MPSANDLLTLATTACRAAGDYLRRVDRPSDPRLWTAKGRADWATEVDRTSEKMITGILTEGAPGSTVVGEELSPAVVTRGLVWIVDPLDGTTNFLHGFPAFAVSIAAAVDGVLQAAAVLHVPLDRLTTATLGGGADENGAPIRVSSIADPAHALVGTGFPYQDFSKLGDYLGQFTRVTQASSGVRRPGSAAIDLADVAAGRFEGFWEQRLSAWDIAAGTLLVREAGGRVTNFAGRDLGVEHAQVVAGNPAIHTWLLEMLRPAVADDFPLALFADSVAAATPAPAGGSVAAVCAALAAALTGMVGRLAQARAGGDDRAGLVDLIESADRARARLLQLAEADGKAFLALIAARKNPEGSDTERAERVLAAWRGATRLPAEVVRLSRQVAQLAHRAAREGPASTIGDSVMAALIAAATAAGSQVNLRLNLQAAGRPEDLRVLADQSETVLRETQRAAADTRLVAEERLTGANAKPAKPGVGGAA